MFELKQSSDVRGDCTADYEVILDKEYTVGEFARAVLSRENEWGRICLNDEPGAPRKPAVFGRLLCNYSNGRLLSELPEEIRNKKITAVKADGGWSNIDYLLAVSDESESKSEYSQVTYVPKAPWQVVAYYPDGRPGCIATFIDEAETARIQINSPNSARKNWGCSLAYKPAGIRTVKLPSIAPDDQSPAAWLAAQDAAVAALAKDLKGQIEAMQSQLDKLEGFAAKKES